MVFRLVLLVLVCSSAFSSGAHEAAAKNVPIDARCQQVVDSPPWRFRGRTLVETPDITAPELRRANALLSSRCRTESERLLASYRQARPDDFHADFLEARLMWTGGDDGGTEELLNATLHAPTDLWVFMDLLMLEAIESPSAALRDELLEINRNPAFPPSAREMASQAGRRLPNLSREQYEAYFWADLDYESATPMACKIHNLAFNLVVVDGRYPDARKLLESPKALAANCSGVEGNRILLAETYLFEAARISAGPSPSNAALVSKADEVLRGDWTGLSMFIMGRPQYAAIAPFVSSQMAPSDVDASGRTQLCNAVMTASVQAVQTQLDLGADPNGRCEHSSLLGYIVRGASTQPTRADWQRQIVRMLRAAGAQVTPQDVASCRNPDNGPACRNSLLPLLEP